jgi:predicted SAM-dependent methyltransferase
VLLVVVGTINRYPPPGFGWTVTHVDKSTRGIWDPALGQNIPIDVQADMRQLPFADHSIDRLQCWHALEHVNELGGQHTLKEFKRVLVPGGILDLRVPDLDYIQGVDDIDDVIHLIYGDQSLMPDHELNVHQWGYTERSLRTLVEDHGFTAERIPAEYPDEIHFLCS